MFDKRWLNERMSSFGTVGKNITLPACFICSVRTFLPVLESHIKLQCEDECVFSRRSPNHSRPRPKQLLRRLAAMEHTPVPHAAPSRSLHKATLWWSLVPPRGQVRRTLWHHLQAAGRRNPSASSPSQPNRASPAVPGRNKGIRPATPVWRPGS